MYNNSANTKFTGKSIHFLPSCHSTNTVAGELIRDKKSVNGLIVITNKQTAGRGQQGNTWISNVNLNLTFSAIFFPQHLFIRDAFYLNIVASLAIAKTVREFVPKSDVKVKWPNDILLDEKKVCGILIENKLRGELIHSVIMGIGLNVNHSDQSLPFARAMSTNNSELFSLQEVLDRICENIELFYLMLEGGQKENLYQLYLQNLYGLDINREFCDSTGNFRGYIRDVTSEGMLRVEKESGEFSNYKFKEVSFIQSKFE